MKTKIRILSFLFCAALLLATAGNVYATEYSTYIGISNEEQFLRFAQNCSLDTYSHNTTVRLLNDLDLTGLPFNGIATFSGRFNGDGHRITGIDLKPTGSVVGFFRYLTEEAVVEDLHLEGTLAPDGSGSMVGGFAGNNAGTIRNCSFVGTVSGIDSIGGIAGVNTLTGVIENCHIYGSVYGNHFIGGIAGTASGVIRDCLNYAQINTTIEQNSVELGDITLDSVTNTELAVTVTDVGGICGTGDGVIRNCMNYGTVGYLQMGYNIGGIAGSYSGYLCDSVNYGAVDGRKEVGGIVGQLEPAVSVVYTEDTLQTLQQQMDNMSALTGSAGSSIQTGSSAITGEAENLEQQLKEAQDALEVLMPDENDPQLPDEDALQAAQNALNSALSDMTVSINAMASATDSTLSSLNSIIKSISGEMGNISETIGQAEENVGGGISDISDLDTAEDLSAKLYRNYNHGHVQGDFNVGGIAGSVSFENDLDPESDVLLIGNTSMNFDMQLRAVILACENQGNITGKKQNAGGIVGSTTLGLIKDCYNYGTLDAASTEYAGGVVGRAGGFIRHSGAKCFLNGDAFVGGIAGSAATVSDCFAIVQFESGSENLGSLFGSLEALAASGNYYFPAPGDPGAVDGISYQGKAEAMGEEDFFSLPGLPRSFRNVTATFLFEDGSRHSMSVPYGVKLYGALFPEITADGYGIAAWEGPIAADEHIYYDAVFTVVQTEGATILESDVTGRNHRPVFLAQGHFKLSAQLTAQRQTGEEALDAWAITLPESPTAITLRYQLPADANAEKIILQQSSGSDWTDTAFTVDGTYLVFTVNNDATALRLISAPRDFTQLYLICAGAVVLAVLVTVIVILRKKKKKVK